MTLPASAIPKESPVPRKEIVGAESKTYTLYELNELFPGNRLHEVLTQLQEPGYKAFWDLIEKLGARVYLTGGIIRDSLIGKEPKDFDFVVTFPGFNTHKEARATFENFFGSDAEAAESEGGIVKRVGEYGVLKLTGEGFGVYKFYPADWKVGEEPIDIAFPRREQAIEGSLGGSKHFDVQSDATLPIEEDIKRRDFTVNALMLELQPTEDGADALLIDAVGGVEDLQDMRLKAVGDPMKRLGESRDRVPRAIRFWCQKGLVMNADLEAAVRFYAQGNIKEGGEIPPLFEQVDRDGKRIVSKERAATEFLKGFGVNPAQTIRRWEEFGLLEQMFPDLYAPRALAANEIPKYVQEKLEKLPQASELHGLTDEQLRREQLEKSVAALKYHQANFGDSATIEEYLYLLFHELGKTTQTIKDPDNHYFYPISAKLSAIQFKKVSQEAVLSVFPAAHKFHPDTDLVISMIKKQYNAIGVLGRNDLSSTLYENGELVNKSLAEVLYATFPGLLNDPLLRVLESDMHTTPGANGALNNLPLLKMRLIELEEFGNGYELDKAEEVIKASDLIQSFFLPPGKELGDIYNFIKSKYLTPVNLRRYSVEELRRLVYIGVINHPEVIRKWNSLISDEALDLFGDTGENKEHTIRALRRAVARRAFLEFTGETLEEAAELSGNIWGLLNTRSEEDGDGFRRERITPFVSRFVTALQERPMGVFDWLEKEFQSSSSEQEMGSSGKRKRRRAHEAKETFASILLPEVKAMIGCTQDPLNHSEGDVFVHTRGLFEAAQQNRFDLSPELAVALLFHDSGKPATRSEGNNRVHFLGHESKGAEMFDVIAKRMGLNSGAARVLDVDRVHYLIENHGVWYGKWIQQWQQGKKVPTLELRELMPNGTEDDLYKLMVCDEAAAVPMDESMRPVELFAHIKERLKLIDYEQEAGVRFEDVFSEDFMDANIGQLRADQKEVLYELFIRELQNATQGNDKINVNTLREQVLSEFVRLDVRNAAAVIKKQVNAKKLMTLGVEAGPDLGKVQRALANEVFKGNIALEGLTKEYIEEVIHEVLIG